MQTHGPSCLEGPISGTRAWWQQAADSIVERRAGGDPGDDGPSEGFRADLVARVREAIAAGTYDTPEKWEMALDRLLQELETE